MGGVMGGSMGGAMGGVIGRVADGVTGKGRDTGRVTGVFTARAFSEFWRKLRLRTEGNRSVAAAGSNTPRLWRRGWLQVMR